MTLESIELAISVIGMILGPVLTVCVMKYALNQAKNPENLMEIADSLMEYFMNTEEGRQKIYLVGMLIGKGARDGAGFGGKGGKMGLKDLIQQGIGQLVAQGASKLFGGSGGSQNQQEQGNTQDLFK